MTLSVQLVDGPPDDALTAELRELGRRVDGADLSGLLDQLVHRHRVLSCLARDDGRLVGYKIGFEERPGYFESWIGAVDPEHRRRGIARKLMRAQHEWCRERGYRIVSTITTGDNQPMLIANLGDGFEICGTFWDRRKILKVVLQKQLPPPEDQATS
ncbi:MAG: GNAT family N-acetyltransferase [Acidobacteriota bacterium]